MSDWREKSTIINRVGIIAAKGIGLINGTTVYSEFHDESFPVAHYV